MIGHPALNAGVIDFFGHENKSFSLALYTSLFDAGLILGSPLFGWISDMSDYRVMYFVAGTLLLVFVSIFTYKSPSLSIKK